MLDPASLMFVGWDADHEDVAFVTTTDLPAGEVIYFTDSEWNGSAFNPGEQLIEWVVPPGGVSKGTLLTLDMIPGAGADARIIQGGILSETDEVGTIDYIQGGGALAARNEMLWAFQGTRDGDDVTPTNFIAVIGNEADGNDARTPNLTNTGLTSENGAIIIDGDHDYMVFTGFDAINGPVSAENAIAAISDISNWTVDGAGLNPDDNNPSPDNGFSVIVPKTIFDENDVTTLYFTGEEVGFFDSIDDATVGGQDASEISISAQPFDPSALIEIDILNTSIRSDGEFDFDEVIFVAIRVTENGDTEEYEVEEGSKIKESGATNSDPGQAKEQGDTFFTTNDEVGTFLKGFATILPLQGVTGKMVFARGEVLVEGETTTIVREQDLFDDLGDPVGTKNSNFYTGLNDEPPPIPCFVAGTLIDTKNGPIPVEELKVRDLVRTLDHGYQPIRWIGRAVVPASGDLIPVRFPKGSIGNERDLWVSQHHRMYFRSWQAELLLGMEQVLMPASQLCSADLGHKDRSMKTVEYVHLLFDRHEIIFAEGCPAESLDPVWLTEDENSDANAREALAVFPVLKLMLKDGKTARPVARRYESLVLVAEH